MADRICDNCMSRVPAYAEKCPRCGIKFENTNPGGALPNGWVLGSRYTVGRYIDIDGEGVMYSAIDSSTTQRVIIKEFMPVTLCASRDEDGSIRPKPGCEVLFKTTRMDFTDLFGSVLRLGRVEGLVQVLDVFEENNTGYAVVEKIEGPTLAEYLTRRENPLDAARALAMLRPVLNGVEALHTSQIIHRGISPENIILESGGTARLSGFATLALRQNGSELKPKLYPGYSAPEQYAASEFEGRYTDIYALGAVLYRLLCGYAPQPADERKMQDEMKSARAVNKEVPAFLSTGIARALRIAPAERIQSLSDLRLALSGEGPREARGPLGLSRRNLIIAAGGAGAVVLILLIVLLVSVFTRQSGGDDSSSSSSSSVPSSSSSAAPITDEVPEMEGKRVADIINNPAYTDKFLFAEPTMQDSDTVESGYIISQQPAAGTPWDGTPIKLVVSNGPAALPLPDLTQKDQAEAGKWLNDNGVLYTTQTVENTGDLTPGIVTKTDPAAGTSVKPGVDRVVLHVAGQPTTKPMPELRGQTEAQVRAALEALGVQYQIEYYVNNVGVKANGTVQSTGPAVGEQIMPDATTVVKVLIYKNFLMPNFDSYIGQPCDVLKAELERLGIPFDPAYQNYPGVSTSDINLVNPPRVSGITYGVGVGGEVTTASPMFTYTSYNYVEPPPPPPPPPSSSTPDA